MHFLSSRSVEPSRRSSELDVAGARNAAAGIPTQDKIFTNGVLKRVTTLFNPRKRTLSKNTGSLRYGTGRNAPVGFIRDTAIVYPRSSCGSSTGSPDEIRRPSGLGRRASLMESLQLPIRSDELMSSGESGDRECKTGSCSLQIPVELWKIILSFLPKSDLYRVALVSTQFHEASCYAMYHSLDFQTISEPRIEKLCIILATCTSLATRVRFLSCHFWPATMSSNGHPVPSLDFMNGLHNMSNLESLTIRPLAPVLLQSPSLPFRLKTLVILDDIISPEQIADLLRFLKDQTSLQSLALPNIVEQVCSSEHSSFQGPIASTFERETILPSLSQLHAPPQLITRICSLLRQPLHTVVLDITTTLYTGLRPAEILRAIRGVSELDVVFTHEVDKRTVEKFLGAAGAILSMSDDPSSRGLVVLEVEVLWMEDDTAETLYAIIDSVISRYNGLRTLKLTMPFRSRRTQTSTALSSVPLPLSISSPISSSSLLSVLIASPVGGTVSREFVSSGTEKTHAKMWTQACSTLSEIQIRFMDPSLDVDIPSCGVWFRRKM